MYNSLFSFFCRSLLSIAIIVTSTIPILRQFPEATVRYLSLLEQSGMLVTDATSPVGVGMSPSKLLPEEIKKILPSVSSNGEPVGLLLNREPSQLRDNIIVPSSASESISVSRIQSTYASTSSISTTLTITLFVRNNQFPSMMPEISITSTVTDIISSTLAADFYQDPNVVHNVLLVDSLLSENATLISTKPTPVHNGESLVWNLGDILPLGSISVTLEVLVPADIITFTDLDIGATVWGTSQGRVISASTLPASLAPDAFEEWLIRTIDADYYDEDVMLKMSELNNDWQRMFSYVRSLEYESYKGSLRGAKGTLWSEAGNSLDRTSLLIAMLRGSGIPARYRHGVLSIEAAQSLILSMFSEPSGTIGYIPSSTAVADPANDPQLLTETIDHWWVEAYLPSLGWTDLDTSFAEAAADQTFHHSLVDDGTDRIPEVPNNTRHKVGINIEVEHYHPLYTSRDKLSYSYPLSYTFNSVELVGKSVTLDHLVDSDQVNGLTFWRVEHTYVPHLVINDYEMVIEGNPFHELFSNFPFGNSPITGEWLNITLWDAEGNTETYEREIVDLIGIDKRLTGGDIEITVENTDPIISEFDLHTLVFAPQTLTPKIVNQNINKYRVASWVQQLRFAQEQVNQIDLENVSLETNQNLQKIPGQLKLAMIQMSYAHILYFLAASDMAQADRDVLMLTKSYFDSPRILAYSFSIHAASEETNVAFDLRKDNVRILSAPGQSPFAAYCAQMARGFLESSLEGVLFEELGISNVIYTPKIFQLADQQNIKLVAMDSSNLTLMQEMNLSAEIKGRLTNALTNGKVIILPEAPVQVGSQSLLGWYEIDALTGETIGVMETGLHGLHDYLVSMMIGVAIGLPVGFIAKIIIYWFVQACLWLRYTMEGIEPGDVAKEAAQYLTGQYLTFGNAGSDFFSEVLGGVFGKVWQSTAHVVGSKLITQINLAMIHGFLDGNLPTLAARDLGKLLYVYIPQAANVGGFLGIWGGSYLAGAWIIQKKADDPPLPEVLFQDTMVVPHKSRGEAVGSHLTTCVFSTTSFSATIVAPFSNFVSFSTPIEMTSDLNTFDNFDVFTCNATLYDFDGVRKGTGRVSSNPYSADLSVLASDDNSNGAVFSIGTLSTYAPALPGLAAGTDWLTYTAELTSTQPYTLTLTDAVVTVNDSDVYTGDFTLVVTGTTVITGSGHTAAPNFADAATMQAQDAQITLGPSPDSILVGGEPLSITNGLALAHYSGPVTITEETSALDRVELDGAADFFTLNLAPESAVTDPVTPVSFQVAVSANFTDTYTTTVEAPEGWNVELDASGVVTATPPLGAHPGDYTLLVTVQSSAYPDLFLAAEHTVTVTPYQGMASDVAYDTLITVPTGKLASPPLGGTGGGALPGDTNDGRAQVPQAAYTVDITNTSTTSHTFAIDVDTAFPAGWLILSGAEGATQTAVTLPAGGIGQIGLYISPTLQNQPLGVATGLLAPGTAFPFTVSVTADNPALAQTHLRTFTMPAVAFNYLEADPAYLYATPGVTASFDLRIANVGNAPGSFALTTTAPVSTWVVAPPYNVTLGVAESDTRALSFIPGAASLGSVEVLQVSSPAPNSAYTQTEYIAVRAAGPCVVNTHRAARVATLLEDGPLSTALSDLTFQLGEWERDEANAALQSRTVDALNAVIARLTPYPLISTNSLVALAAAPTVAGFCDPLAALAANLTSIERRMVVAELRPGYDAALVNSPVTYTLTLENQGSLTAAYRTTLRLTKLVNQQIANEQIVSPGATFTTTVAPGQTVSVPVVLEPATLGFWQMDAEIAAVEDSFIRAQTGAGLNAVNAFVKVLSVTATPAFVDTGASSTTLAVRIANVADLYQVATAQARIWAADGRPVYTATAALSLPSGAPRAYILGNVSTSGWAAGRYTITLDLRDANGAWIPDGSGAGFLAVGQMLHAGHSVSPTLVAPGTVTVTTDITTEIDPDLNSASLPDQESGLARQESFTAKIAKTAGTLKNLRALRASVVNSLRAPGLSAWLLQETQPFSHYEENSTWTYTGSWSAAVVTQASGSGARQATAAGAMAQLTFSGVWAHVGFVTAPGGGSVAVFIDGQPQGVINTSSAITDVTGALYPNLGAGTHVLTLTTQSAAPVLLDFADVWNGVAKTTGRFESNDATHVRLNGGSQGSLQSTDQRWYTYTTGLANAWFLFTGDHVRVEGVTINGAAPVELWVDGVNLGTLDLSYEFTASPVAQTLEGLGSGPHVLRLALAPSARLDAFDTTATPFVGVPMVEWWDSAPAGSPYGVVSTAAAGDLDGDGDVEVIVSSSDRYLYAYNGDGAPGETAAYIWTAHIGMDTSAPALADLDGQPGAEIVVDAQAGLSVFDHDGALVWRDTGITPEHYRGGPLIANLDNDPAPEIILSSDQGLNIYSAGGVRRWQYPLSSSFAQPALSNLDGDSYPEILALGGKTLSLFKCNGTLTPTLVWTQTTTKAIDGRESPAIADLYPDVPGPEIVIAWNQHVEVRAANNGSLLGKYYIGGVQPGPVAIADTDGDGKMNIVVSVMVNSGTIFNLKPQPGAVPTERLALLWSATAKDEVSGSGLSVHDLDGNGSWEVLWNGEDQGVTVYDGSYGHVLYNEPEIRSRTTSDYPIVADVDDDGHAEIVSGAEHGIYIIGHDAAWAPSRPLWNEYNYRVTNIADDLTVPPVEPPSGWPTTPTARRYRRSTRRRCTRSISPTPCRSVGWSY